MKKNNHWFFLAWVLNFRPPNFYLKLMALLLHQHNIRILKTSERTYTFKKQNNIMNFKYLRGYNGCN